MDENAYDGNRESLAEDFLRDEIDGDTSDDELVCAICLEHIEDDEIPQCT